MDGDVVEDQQIVAVKPRDCRLQSEFAARHLQALHEVGGAREQHAPAVLDQRQAECCREMTLADASMRSMAPP